MPLATLSPFITSRRHSRVFISYARDSEVFSERVRMLAADLRSRGIDARIDQYEGARAEGWVGWLENSIRESAVVLLVCSPRYLSRVNAMKEPGKGRGAAREPHLISQQLYEA